MKKRILALGLVFMACAGLTVYKGSDSWTFRSTGDFMRTAIELWPTKGRTPLTDAKAEVVLYRDVPVNGNYERMNWSAMNDGEPMYRFGVEAGGTGVRRPIWFCFERPESERGQPAYCPLKLDPDQGVLVCNKQQECFGLGEQP